MRRVEEMMGIFMFQIVVDKFNRLILQIVISNYKLNLKSQFATSKNSENLRFQNGTSNGHDGRRYFPYVFTGVAILSAVLRSETAIKKYNEQYPAIEIKEFKNSHDRFIIIDNTTVYHFGASLKDLGKNWFAFSKRDIGANEVLTRLEGMKA